MALAIANQPAENKINFARSPIFYKFTGCDSSTYTYQVKVYLTQGLTNTLTEYVYIDRTPDLNNYIVFNVSNIVLKYLKTNISITNENACYVKLILSELTNGSETATIESNICVVTMGGTDYMDGVNFSSNGKLSSTPNILYLPNYGGTGNIS